MKQYRRKAEYLQAQQWHTGDSLLVGMVADLSCDGGKPYGIHTSKGWMRVGDADWMVKDGAGIREVIEPAAFEQLYEPVE